MPVIHWTSDLSINIAEIDRQHQQLIRLLNDLDEVMRKGREKDALGKIILSLIGYTATHFSTEEKLFDRFGYPETVPHQKEHSGFVKKVTSFHREFNEGGLELTIPVMNFLMEWLKNHISGSDKRYAPFLNERGLK